jgi:hypothetical protein
MSQFIGPNVLAENQRARVPFGLNDLDGLLPVDRNPESLEVTVRSADGGSPLATVEIDRHDDGIPRAYYPLEFEAGDAGFYTASTTVEGQQVEMSVQVHSEDELTLIRPGQPLPGVHTPTEARPRGVTPICTREPACPLHEVSLVDALDEGRPIALLLATPAFCQIAVCGPVLDVLLDAMPEDTDIRFLHAEIYNDPFENLEETTDVVRALPLHFEPALVLADARGMVVERLDTIFDRREAQAALARLGGTAG